MSNSMDMRIIVSVLIILCHSILFSQQNMVVNHKYPFRYMPTQSVPHLAAGNYHLRTDADYFNILNPDVFHPNQMPATSLYNDFGMVLKRDDGILVIDSIVETNYNVVIYTKIKTHYCSVGITSESAVFIRLKRTNKEIIISEIPAEPIVQDKSWVRAWD